MEREFGIYPVSICHVNIIYNNSTQKKVPIDNNSIHPLGTDKLIAFSQELNHFIIYNLNGKVKTRIKLKSKFKFVKFLDISANENYIAFTLLPLENKGSPILSIYDREKRKICKYPIPESSLYLEFLNNETFYYITIRDSKTRINISTIKSNIFSSEESINTSNYIICTDSDCKSIILKDGQKGLIRVDILTGNYDKLPFIVGNYFYLINRILITTNRIDFRSKGSKAWNIDTQEEVLITNEMRAQFRNKISEIQARMREDILQFKINKSREQIQRKLDILLPLANPLKKIVAKFIM